jgi:hypothetical protein
LAADFGDDRVVLLRDAEVEELLGVLDVPRELLRRFDPQLDAGALSRYGLGLLRVVPEPGRERLFVQAVDFPFQLGDVKDAPLAS